MKNFFAKFWIFLIISQLFNGVFLPTASAQAASIYSCAEWELVQVNNSWKCKTTKETIYRNNYEFKESPSGMGWWALRLFNNWVYQDINLNFASFFYSGNNRRSRKIGVELYSGWTKKLNENISLFSFLNVPAGGKEYILAGLGDDTFSVKIDGRTLVNESGAQAYGSLKLYPIFLEEWEHLIEFLYNNYSLDGGLAAEIIGEFDGWSFLNPNGTVKVANIVEHFGRSPSTSWRNEWTAVTAPVNWTSKIKWNSRQYLSTGADKNNVISQNYGHTCETGYEVLFEKTGLTYSKTPICVKYTDPIIADVIPSTGNTKPAGYVTVTFLTSSSWANLTGEKVFYVKPNTNVTLVAPEVSVIQTWYDFNRWTKNFANQSFTEDTIIEVEYIRERFVAIFRNENNGAEVGKKENIVYGDKINTDNIQTPTKEWHNFVAWKKQGETTAFDFVNTTITQNIIFEPIFEPKKFIVEFKNDDGTEIFVKRDIPYNTLTNATGVPIPTKNGHTFARWTKEGTTEGFAFATTRIRENIVLVPVYQKNTYNLVFRDEARRPLTSAAIKKEWGSLVTTEAITLPTKVGHTLIGWLDFNTKLPWDLNTPITKNLVLDPIFEKNKYSVEFKNEDDSIITSKTDIPYDTKADTGDIRIPSKVGYNFLGWSENGRDIFDFITTTITRNMIVKPVFEIKKYTVDFKNEDDSLIRSKTDIPHDTTTNETGITRPTKEWYNFVAWSLDGINPFNFATTTITSNIILKPIFEKRKYNVTFRDWENRLTLKTKSVPHGDFTNSDEVNPTKNGGFRFVEWQTVDGVPFDFANTPITGNIILVPHFQEIPKSWIILNEIGYRIEKNGSVDNSLDFIEIYNPADASLDISGFKIVDNTDKTESSKIILPANTIIPAKWYYIVSNNAAAFKEKYWFDPNIAGNLNLGSTGSSTNRYSVQIVDNFEREIDIYEWGGDANESLDNRNICRIENIWKNTCQHTPNAVNSENSPTITLSKNTINHNETGVEIGNFGVENTNNLDTIFSYSKAKTVATKYSNNLFEITADNKLKYIGDPTDFFTKNSYTILVEVKWDKGAYNKQDLVIDVIEPKYRVTYRFIDEDGGELPDEIKNIPSTFEAREDLPNGATITRTNNFTKTFPDANRDGTWNFVAWNVNSHKINKADFEFVGTWKFTPNTYSVNYIFEKNSPKNLPASIVKPENLSGKLNNTEIIFPTIASPVTDTENDGTWTFDNWNNTEKATINKANLDVTGTWTFTPNTYKATFAFEKADAVTKELPAEIFAQLPVEITGKTTGEIINAESLNFVKNFPKDDGTWTFTGWDENTKTINKANVHFIGKWNFEYKDATISYNFIAKNTDKILPNLDALKPDEKIAKFSQNITAENPKSDTFVDEAQDGTWNFVGYNNSPILVDSETETFVWEWIFTPNKHKVSHKFVSGTAGKTLPTLETLADITEKVMGDSVEPVKKIFENITDSVQDGIWKFAGWNPENITIGKTDAEFVGTWNFSANNYIVDYSFTTTSGKTFPQSIVSATPRHLENQIKGTPIVFPNVITPVTDTENDGIWTFEGWDKSKMQVEKSNVTVFGNWTFTPNTYEVTHTFATKNTDKELPQAIKDRLPAKQTGKINTNNVTPTENFEKNFIDEVNDGTWTFDSWDSASKTINKANVNFEGFWTFKANEYTATFTFENLDNLPEEIKNLLNNEQPKKGVNGAKITPTNNTFANVTITDTANPANTGTWRFRGWDKREKFFEKSDLTFIGKWEFRVKKATIKYFYTENVDGRDLPAALTPPSSHQDDFGTTTIPSLPDTNFFDEWDGRWGTDGFLPEEEFVDKDVEIFTAEWFFTPKKWKVVSSFYSHTNGRDLPNEVLSLLTQEEKDGIEMNYGTIITPKIFADVEVASGTWKLTGSDVADHPNNNEFMDQEEELIYYYWQFSPKPAKIISEFKSATSRELPDEVKNLLPAEKNTFFEAENNLENFANISLATGTWSATGANEDGDNIVNKDIEKNIYTWAFTPKNSKIIYHFESADVTELPAEINAFKPNEKPTTFEATENAQNPTQTTHEVDNGTWNFVSYNADSLVVDEEIETFTGKWKFTPSIVNDESEKLPNFVKIIFTIPENKGTSSDTKIFFVNPTKNIALTAPNISAKTGYTFKNWDKNTTGIFTENTEIIAIFDSTNIEVEEKNYNVSLATNGEIDIPDSAENFVKNLQNLPAGTTFAWKDGIPKINKNNVGPRDFTIIAKIPGEADKEITVRINFNDDIKPDMSDIPDSIEAFVGDEINKRFEISDNNGSPLSEATGLFPGLNYDGDQHILSANIPLDTVPKEYEITISATDDFGNIGTKTIKVKIKPLTEKFLPEAEKKVVEVKTPLDQISPKNSIKNADDLPTGTDFAWDMPPALDEVANDVPASVKITYPDGSAENITVSFDIVDTKKPTITWEKNISHPVGSENAKNFDPLSEISVNDNFYQNLTPNCSVNPAYDATKIGTYTVTCDVTDPSNNTAETFTRTIEIMKIDKQKLIDLLQKITDDFNDRPDKITNPTADDEAKNVLDTAIKNDNLSLEDLEKIFEKYKDVVATRDETAPTGQITADKTDWTNTDVTLTLTTDKPVSAPNGWTQKDADGKIFEKILTANENISVNFTDNYGNSGTATKNVENIDKIAPICGDFTHSPTTPTRGNVIFTMANMSDALSGLVDGQNYTCEVTENGQKCSLIIVDKAGNTQTCESPAVKNIDRTAPNLTLSADVTAPTNGNVKITLTSNEPLQNIDGWIKINDTTFEKIFENNENVSVTARDTAGNESTATIKISNIDKTPPSGEVTGSPTNWINNNVTLTLKTTKPVETPTGWTKVDDMTFTKNISENETGNLTVTDKVGNTSVNISYNVLKIDKEKPVVTTLAVEWDKTLIQSASVKINFTGNDTGGSEIKNFECKLNNGLFVPCASEFTFDNLVEWENTISVRVIDNAGNISDVKDISVTKDSTAPNFTNLTNKEFDEDKNISEIIFTTDGNDDEISVVSALPTGLSYDRNAKKITGTPTEPGVYQVSVEATDKAGNKKSETFTITILDKTAPNITLNTAPTTLVKWQVYTEAGATCTDNSDTTCSVQISGNVDSDGVWDYTITYTATDKAGNVATKTRSISVVSGETPIITLLWDADVVVELGSTYADAGATAADQEDGDISPNIVTENLVNANVLGDYEVKYNITDSSGNKAPEVKRLVRVVDTTAPKIENISDQIFDEKSPISPIKIEVSDLNPVVNISVENLPNGLVYNETSKQIEGTPTEISEKIVKIIAIDGSGNKTETTFVIKITDIEKPIISGQDSFTFFAGSSEAKNFDPLSGIIATDNNDADIQDHLKCDINPQYNVNNSGRYSVICNVTDVQWNVAETFTRTIILEQRTVSGPGGGGYTGGGNNAGASSGDTIITPVTSNTPQNPTHDTNPQITDILPTQNISPTDKTLDNQKIFKVNNRVTDYICEEIVQAYDYPSLKFVDNPRNKTFHDDISALAMFRGLEKDEMNLGQTYLEYKRHGVVLNVAKFEPNRNVTRAEFVKMLVRSLSCRYTFMGTDTGFKDISGDEWHAEYIKFAVENGWVNGYSDGNFRPNAPITRAEAAKILSRSIQLATTGQTTTNFTDIPANSEFIPYIETLKTHGIMKGRDATTFAPDAHIPRTETSRIIYRTFFGGTH